MTVKAKNILKNSAMAIVILLFFRFVYRCPVKLLFDIPCPGCGMTRAVWYFCTFRFPLSFAYNPLAVFVIIAAFYYLIVRRFKRIPEKWENVFIYTFSAALIAVWAVRFFITGWSVPI